MKKIYNFLKEHWVCEFDVLFNGKEITLGQHSANDTYYTAEISFDELPINIITADISAKKLHKLLSDIYNLIPEENK